MAGSDTPPGRKWPQTDRRAVTDRRRRSERRTGRFADASVEADRRGRAPRRKGPERRGGEDTWLPVSCDAALMPEDALLAAAAAARERAQAPYSRFKVGAVLETRDGAVVSGCNVESASYGLTLCAERVALVKALSEGHTAFVRLAVVADTERPTPPCGACRQLLWEYCGDIDVHLGNLERPTGQYRLQALLPVPFDRTLLE